MNNSTQKWMICKRKRRIFAKIKPFDKNEQFNAKMDDLQKETSHLRKIKCFSKRNVDSATQKKLSVSRTCCVRNGPPKSCCPC